MQYTIYYNLQINTVVKLEIVLVEPDMFEPQCLHLALYLTSVLIGISKRIGAIVIYTFYVNVYIFDNILDTK